MADVAATLAAEPKLPPAALFVGGAWTEAEGGKTFSTTMSLRPLKR